MTISPMKMSILFKNVMFSNLLYAFSLKVGMSIILPLKDIYAQQTKHRGET
jgi:hypothetical protein